MAARIHNIVARATPVLMPVLLLLVAMAAIQSGASVAKQLFPLIGAATTTSLRLILAAILLVGLMRPWRKPIAAGAWPSIAIYGVALGCMNFLFYQALQSVPLGIAVALEFTGPLGVALLSSRRALDLAWVAIALIGLSVLLWPSPGQALSIDVYGAACALGAGACWALYILFGQKAGATNGMQSAVLGIVIAALLIAPIGLWHATSALWSPTVLGLGLGVAVLSTALPYTLEMMAMPRLPTQTFGTLMSLEPAFGALSGLLFLGQTLDGTEWLAIGAIMLASIGATLTATGEDAATVEAPVPD